MSADFLIGAFVFLGGMVIGVSVIDSRGVGDFYRTLFDPAVMTACGHGFGRPVFADTPEGAAARQALTTFLDDPNGAFDCSNLDRLDKIDSPILFQELMPYLLGATSAVWRVRGVSWNALGPLYGALCGMFLCGTYAAARLCSGRALSLGAVLLLGASSLHLEHLPRLRDYAKAPFLIVGIALVGYLVARDLAPKTRLLLAAGFGLSAGIGFGFRIDSLLLLPFFVLSIVCFSPPCRSHKWREAGAICLAAVTVFVLASLPMTLTYIQGGSNSWHFILLGLTDPFTVNLDIETDPTYFFGADYDDYLPLHLVNTYAESIDLPATTLYRRAYDSYGKELYLRYFSTFPADVMVRAYSAVIGVLGLPRWAPLGLGFAIVALAVTFLAAAAPRVGLFATLAIVYFGATSSLQYDWRHHFYLEAFTLVSLALLTQAAVSERWIPVPGSRSVSASLRALRRSFSPERMIRAGVYWGAMLLLGVGSLATARAYQQNAAEERFRELASLRRRGVQTEQERDREGVLTIRPVGLALDVTGRSVMLPARDNTEVVNFYFAARIGGAECGFANGSLALEYVADTIHHDHGVDLNIAVTPDKEALVFFPAFDDLGEERFKGLKLRGMGPGCHVELSTVEESRRVGTPLTVVLDPGWESRRHYQRMKIEGAAGQLLTSYREPVVNVWTSGVVEGSHDLIEVNVPLHGSDLIVLRVDAGGDGSLNFDHANWINPRLTAKQGTLSLVALRPETVDEHPLQHKINTSVVGNPLTVADQAFPTGLGVHSRSRIVFRVPEWFDVSKATLEALAGIDGAAGDQGKVRFYVDIKKSASRNESIR